MNNLQTFNHPMFGELPVVMIDGKEHFGANEVASTLEYARPYKAISDHCDSEGVLTWDVLTNGGTQQKKFITLGNISRLIVAASKQSKNPEIQRKAKQYEKWIFDEVIPSIHKHGAYMTPNALEQAIANPDFAIGLLTNLKEEQNKRHEAEKVIEMQRPKVVYAEAVTVSEDTVLVKDLSMVLKQKGIDIGEVRLFKWMRENGFLCKQKGEMWNMPTQRSLDLGVFVVKHGLRTGTHGEMKKTRTPKITGKGQIYFVNKFIGNEQLLNVK